MSSVELWSVAGVFLLFVVAWARHPKNRARSGAGPPARRSGGDALDRVLMHWTPHDPFTARDLLRGVCVQGASGSGKTSSSLKQILRAIVRDGRVSILGLASKPEEPSDWREEFARHGRELKLFGPAHPLRFNFLDFEVKNGADARQVTQCLMTVSETLDRGSKGGGDRDPFFQQSNKVMIHHGSEVLLRATGTVDTVLLQTFLSGAARTPQEMKGDAWRSGEHNRLLMEAHRNAATPMQKHDFKMAFEYFASQLPSMADKTRSGVEAGVFNILFVLNSGVVKELLNSTTNVTPALLDAGGCLMVDMAVAEWGAGGSIVNAAVKYAAQRHVLRRHATAGTSETVIWVDEFQNHLTEFDSKFLAESRSHKGTLLVASQSLHSFYSEMGGKGGEHAADALLTNFGVKIAHALGDDKSAQYFSSLLGKREKVRFGGSEGERGDVWDEMTGRSRFTSNFSTTVEPVVEPRDFMSGLRTGGFPDCVADAFVIRNGVPFSTGENFLRVAFSQK